MTVRAGVRRAALLLVAAALFGCPLASDKPLSDPGSAAPDPALVGTWQAVDPESGETTLVKILVFNSHEMVAVAPESDPAKVGAMRLFPTRIGAQAFLNIQELGSDGSGWFFASYTLEHDTLRMKIVDDELFKDRTFATSDELRSFIGRNLADPRLYAAKDETPSELVLQRVVPDPSGSSGPKS